MTLHFEESPVYTIEIDRLISFEEHRNLQNALLENPELGKLIPGTGGLRKMRWALAGAGKSGGIRVIYYLQHKRTVYLLFAYRKNRQEDLTTDQKRV